MKHIWIWAVCIVMGCSFISLLYLQGLYVNSMIRMRREQFDESVFRSLDQASRELERNETFHYLQKVLKEHEEEERQTLNLDSMANLITKVQPDTLLSNFNSRFNSMSNATGHLSNSVILPRQSYFSRAAENLQKGVQRAYIYERDILDEVIYSVMYTAGRLDFRDRLNPNYLDVVLRTALENNGITLPFHFVVYTADGREVYRCKDYEEQGNDYVYTQPVFRSDPTGQMGVVTVHFPNMKKYIMDAARYVATAMIFTIILFVTFVITVYLVVRQRKLTELKNDFVHNMTHEFKTPISTISIAAQMLSDKSLPKTEESYERLGGIIKTETRRLRFQVEKVLQMSLFDRNNIALKLNDLDANDLIENVVETFSLKVSQSGGTIQTELKAEHPFVRVDEMHFTNVIFNLMDNAFKYRREDVNLLLSISTYNHGDNLYIVIRDNGIGIQKDALKRIFDRFYRVHTGDRHNVKGFGLGLAYVHKMVELHHGNIRVSSEVGKGSTFTIVLPVIKDIKY